MANFQNALAHMAPFAIRPLVFGVDSLGMSNNKRIMSVTQKVTND